MLQMYSAATQGWRQLPALIAGVPAGLGWFLAWTSVRAHSALIACYRTVCAAKHSAVAPMHRTTPQLGLDSDEAGAPLPADLFVSLTRAESVNSTQKRVFKQTIVQPQESGSCLLLSGATDVCSTQERQQDPILSGCAFVCKGGAVLF